MLGIDEGKEQRNGGGRHAPPPHLGYGCVYVVADKRLDLFSLPIDSSADAEAQSMCDERLRPFPAPAEKVRAPDPPDLQIVGEAPGSEKRDRRGSPLDQSVGGERRADHEVLYTFERDAALLQDREYAAHGIFARVGLLNDNRAGFGIDREQIGEGAADIHANVVAHYRRPFQERPPGRPRPVPRH